MCVLRLARTSLKHPNECEYGCEGKRPQGPVEEVLSGTGFCCKNNSSPLQTTFCLTPVPSHKMGCWEPVEVCMHGHLGCKLYTCAVGIGVENDAKQHKTEGDFHEMLVANLIVNGHVFICKSTLYY